MNLDERLNRARCWTAPRSSRGGRPMQAPALVDTARAIVAEGKGILAADETPGTLTKRLTARAIDSTADSRRDYREMFFTTPSIASVHRWRHPAGRDDPAAELDGKPLVQLLAIGHHPRNQGRPRREAAGRRAGRARHRGTRRAARAPREYRAHGRALRQVARGLHIGEGRPTPACVHANADALARYAALCQDRDSCPSSSPRC